MNAALLAAVVLGESFKNILKKAYNQRTHGRGTYVCGGLISLFAALFFLPGLGGKEGFGAVAPWSLAFAMCYTVAVLFGIRAILYGSLSLSALVSSYSLLLPTLYGLIFLGDPVRWSLLPGICLLAASLLLIYFDRNDARITPHWGFCVFLAFIGNGMCSVVQKKQQLVFEGRYKNEFMLTALLLSSAALWGMALWKEAGEILLSIRKGGICAVSCGLLVGMVNLLVMILNGRLAASVLFPTVVAGGVVVVTLASRLVYGEYLTRRQICGIALGVLSVVLLSIS